jgi:cyclic pyranopterin phosphate synthase
MTGSPMTHIDEKGRVRMVDVTGKEATERTAVATAVVILRKRTLDRILQKEMSKGNVLETARIAGIMAAKKTAELIPMCHPLNLSHAQVDFFPETDPARVTIRARVRLTGRTGVEMEALTAVTVAALTLYDMCKSVDREMRITDVQLMEKTGGKSGTFRRSP